MDRGKAWLLATLAVFALVGAGAFWWTEREAERASAAAEARAAARAEREERRLSRLREESRRLVPDLLEGIHLGMPLADARRARPRMTPQLGHTNPDMANRVVFEERFPNGARAIYFFDRETDRLERIQVLSLLPNVEAVAPHLAAMNEQYGSPTGAWDCPQTGTVPTRRFTWRHGETSIADIFLIYGERVSVTLDIAPSAVMERSLRRSACRPVQSREDLERFPVATPEQLAPDGAR
ncbi:MAG TPA: hypothetical protein VIL20_30270 [Sandaracinaceae bacterium]